MRQLRKKARLWGSLQTLEAMAIVDTGTRRTVVPREIFEAVGPLSWAKPGRETMRIAGRVMRGSVHQVQVEVPAGHCGARVTAFIPDDPEWKLLLLGTDFLQKSGATIRFKGDHPVFCGLPPDPDGEPWYPPMLFA